MSETLTFVTEKFGKKHASGQGNNLQLQLLLLVEILFLVETEELEFDNEEILF